MEMDTEILVIGGGIAGLSAALYTARHGLRTVVISIDLGGQLAYASVIENYPGILRVRGLDLANTVLRQARDFGADFLFDEVVSLERSGDKWVARTRKGYVIRAEAVIAANGKTPRRLGVPGEEEYVGRGVSYCSICDAPLFTGKRVALASFYLKAVEAIELLAPVARKLYYITPDKLLRPRQLEKLVREANVEVYLHSRIVEIKGDGRRVTAVVVEPIGGGERKEIPVDGVFIEMGFVTNIKILEPYVETTPQKEVIVDSYGRTKTPGLFAAGDLVNIPYKQAVIAAASGVTAGLSAINYVFEKKGVRKRLLADWETEEEEEGEEKIMTPPGGTTSIRGKPGFKFKL